MNDTTSHAEPTVVIPIQDRVRGKTERLEVGFSRIGTRIQRFPPGLRGIGGPDGRYITPSVVALGPYHHGLPHLQEMEEFKHAAAHYFCTSSGHQTEEVYGKILSITEEACGCYDEDAVARLSHSQFAEMMYLDGCFLLMYICYYGEDDLDYPPLLKNGMVLSIGPFMLRDIMLLENQLPWLVLEALMTFRHVDVYHLVRVLVGILYKPLGVGYRPGQAFGVNEDCRAPHLLGLVRVYLTVNMPQEEKAPWKRGSYNHANLSAIQLSEMGIKLKANKAAWFPDMSVSKNWRLFGELSISPVFLNEVTAYWLVNIAAFEARTSHISDDYTSDGFVVVSYLSLLAFLMDKEEDVHELRVHHIVTGHLSNQETLEFFKSIARHLRCGYRYYDILIAIEHYKRDRRVWIVIHRFLYKYWKTIVTLISIASVLVGIFRALYSLKHN